MLSEQDETPRSKDRSATSDGMLSVDRDDERETARDEQETERCRPAVARCVLKLVTRAPATCKYHRPPPGPVRRASVSRTPLVLC